MPLPAIGDTAGSRSSSLDVSPSSICDTGMPGGGGCSSSSGSSAGGIGGACRNGKSSTRLVDAECTVHAALGPLTPWPGLALSS